MSNTAPVVVCMDVVYGWLELRSFSYCCSPWAPMHARCQRKAARTAARRRKKKQTEWTGKNDDFRGAPVFTTPISAPSHHGSPLLLITLNICSWPPVHNCMFCCFSVSLPSLTFAHSRKKKLDRPWPACRVLRFPGTAISYDTMDSRENMDFMEGESDVCVKESGAYFTLAAPQVGFTGGAGRSAHNYFRGSKFKNRIIL